MQSELEFYSHDTKQRSDCGNVLEIDFSARELNWQGIVLEKGSSPHFYPNNVYTPYFYFALALDEELHWSVEKDGDLVALKTSPGNIWINPPQTPFTHDIAEPCHFVILAIEKHRFLDACPLAIEPSSLVFLNNYNVVDDSIKGIIELFVIEAKSKGRNGSAYLHHLLSLLSTHFVHNYSNYADLQNARLNASKLGRQQLEKIDAFISQHIGGHIAIDDLADLLFCSKFYFLREFKKLKGVTPYQYILSKRLDKAKEQLLTEKSSIANVAQSLGFNDQSHFTRAFKTQFGLTPGQFVKRPT